VLKVLNVAEKRLSPALARLLYEDHSPPPPAEDQRIVAPRAAGSGRPSKAERRALERFRDR
jgi:ribosome-associated heat shock protein Hsp15